MPNAYHTVGRGQIGLPAPGRLDDRYPENQCAGAGLMLW
jgi:hypothetical protein